MTIYSNFSDELILKVTKSIFQKITRVYLLHLGVNYKK